MRPSKSACWSCCLKEKKGVQPASAPPNVSSNRPARWLTDQLCRDLDGAKRGKGVGWSVGLDLIPALNVSNTVKNGSMSQTSSSCGHFCFLVNCLGLST